MAQLSRRKFLEMVGLGSAVALLPRVPTGDHYADVVTLGNFEEDLDFQQEPYMVEFTVNFNGPLIDDEDARYAIYYADEVDKDGNPILLSEGKIDGRGMVQVPVEIGRRVRCRALGLEKAGFAEGELFVQGSPTLHMIAPVERNYVV